MANQSPIQTAFDPYATPKSRVGDVPAAEETRPMFFPVGLSKLTIMTVGTWGIYEFYWFYQNWKSVRQLTGEKLNAPVRALFYPLTSFSLFPRIRDQGQRLQVAFTVRPGVLATVVLLWNALWRLPDPYWIISFLGFVPLLYVQSAVNKINQQVAPGSNPNTRLGAWNIVALIAGAALLALVVVGMLLGEEGAA